MFLFINELGEYRDYRVKLTEHIRFISTSSQVAITNPKIICYQWDKNGVIEEVEWASKLKACYNNKSKAFFHVDVPNDINYLDEFRLLDGTRLSALIE
jgi:hypothetical protein